MRDTFVKTLIEIAKKDKSVYLITGDLGFGVLKPFWEQLPKQFINAGIAEQAMTGIAAGMAKEGNIVFTYSIGNFPTFRCLEQIRNDCAYHDANVKIVCVGGGFVYGSLGMSHHATEDIAIMRSLPNVQVIAPNDSVEAEFFTNEMYKRNGTFYLRLGRGGEEIAKNSLVNYKYGNAINIKKGKDIAIFYTGSMYFDVSKAAEMLRKKGLNVSIYAFPVIKPIDKETIKQCVLDYDKIFTVEEHNIMGGFGSAICEVAAEIPERKAVIKRIGISDVYSSIVGDQNYLKNEYGISANKIFEEIKTDND